MRVMNVERKTMYNIDACMIKESYNDRRDTMSMIVSLMGYKRYRTCNRFLMHMSKEHDINQEWFNDIVRLYESYTNDRERLTAQELRIYYNYCTINRIVLPH